MADAPREFDWVAARNEWTARKLFDDLKELAKKDTATRNQQLGQDRFRFDEHDGGESFAVFRTTGGNRNAIDVTINGNLVHFSHYGGQNEIDVEPVIDEAGQFKCKVGDSYLETWQVVRKAAEPFFFS